MTAQLAAKDAIARRSFTRAAKYLGIGRLGMLLATIVCLACIIAPAIHAGVHAGSGKETPVVHDGIADLRGWTPDGIIPLDGQWQVAWNHLDGQAASSGAPASSAPGLWDTVPVPGLWNYLPAATPAQREGPAGAATYRLVLYPPANAPDLTLEIIEPLSATRVWVNGRLAAHAGSPALLKAGETARSVTLLVPIAGAQSRVTVAIEISNHFHFEGGMGYSILIAPRGLLETQQEKDFIGAAVVIGALLMMAVYAAAFGRATQANGWGWVITQLIILALRESCTSEILYAVDPTLPAIIPFRLEYLCLYASWVVYYRILRSQLPGYRPKWMPYVIYAGGGAGFLITLVMSPMVFTHLRDPGCLFLVFLCCYYAGCILAAVRRGETGSWLLCSGLILFLMAAIHDGLMYAHIIMGMEITPFAGLVFMFTHVLALGQRFIMTSRRVQQLSTELTVLNRGLEEQVALRTREINTTLDKLGRAKEQAEKIARNKTRFLAHLSHEVRTPLNTIMGMATLLARDQPRVDQGRRLDLMRFAGNGLVSLLDDILDMSSIEAGNLRLHPASFDLHSLCTALADTVSAQCAVKGLAFEERICRLPPAFFGDSQRLQQILMNLLGNAVKFTDRGTVSFTVEAREKTASVWGLRFLVTDTGPGIPASLHEQIFEEFVRGNSTTAPHGSGLGLAIVRRFASAMGGQTTVHTSSEGGSTFTFTLDLPEGRMSDVDDERSICVPKSTGRDILLVEDTPESRHVMQELLAPYGFRITCANSGQDALRNVSERRFDMVLLDMFLDDMRGEEVARHIRSSDDPAVARIPLIAVTANVMETDILRYAQAGIDEVVAKPVALKNLFDAMNRLGQKLPNQDHIADDIARALQFSAPVFARACGECAIELSQGLAARDASRIIRVAHRLTGSAPSFGYVNLGQAASRLEQEMRRNPMNMQAAEPLETLLAMTCKVLDATGSGH